MTHEELLVFGERIRNARNNTALTQEHVSNEIGISLRFYQMIERGEKSVSLDTLKCLGTTLGVSIDYLLFGSLPHNLANPIAEIYSQLNSRQRDDATKILQLYLAACWDNSLNKESGL